MGAPYLDALLGRIFSRGTEVEARGGLNFSDGFSVVDNPSANRLDVKPSSSLVAQSSAVIYVTDTQYAGGAVGDGVTDDTAAIVAAEAARAASGGVLAWPAGSYLTDAVTVGASHFVGGVVVPASGETVTFGGAIEAPQGAQIFDTSEGGTVLATGVGTVHVEWWGISASPADSTDAFQQAWDSARAVQGGRVLVPPGTWLVSKITSDDAVENVRVEGASGFRYANNATTIRFSNSTSSPCWDLGGSSGDNSYGIEIRNLVLWSYQDDVGMGPLIDATYCVGLTIERCGLQGNAAGVSYLLDARGSFALACRDVRFKGGQRATVRRTASITSGSSGEFSNCWFEDSGSHPVLNPGNTDVFIGCVWAPCDDDEPGAIECDADADGVQQNVSLVGCYCSDAAASGTWLKIRGKGWRFVGGFYTATIDANNWDVRIIQAAGALSDVTVDAIDWRCEGSFFDANGQTIERLVVINTDTSAPSGTDQATFWEGGVVPADSSVINGASIQRGSIPRLDPAQLTADVDDWSLAVSGVDAVFADSDASRDVTGIVAVAGASFMLINDGAQNIVLKHADASSAAGNRFACSTGADITLAAGGIAMVFYDSASAVWRVS